MSKARAAQMAGAWWAARLQQGDKVQFAREVETRVLAALHDRDVVYLECDYDPWDILLEAVRAIGIPCSGFMFSADGILPRKHRLRVTATQLSPKAGYGNWGGDIAVPDDDTQGGA